MSFMPLESGPRIGPDKINYQDLWQYFEGRGSALKDSLLSLMTLLLGFTSAVLGFAIEKALDFSTTAQLVKQPGLLFLLSAIGSVLVAFGLIVTQEFGSHINRNFDRAQYSQIGDRPLDEILSFSEKPEREGARLPNICLWMRGILLGFGVMFVAGLALSLR